MNILNGFELELMENFREVIGSSFTDAVLSTVTRLGDYGIVWIITAILLLCFRKTRRMGIAVSISLIMGLIFGNLLLKPLVARIRPYNFDPSIVLLVPPERDYSFPSGHTLASFEGAVTIFLYNKPWGTATLILAAVIAVSRVYLMLHYPIDVLAGAVLGTIFAFFAMYITDRLFSHDSAGR